MIGLSLQCGLSRSNVSLCFMSATTSLKLVTMLNGIFSSCSTACLIACSTPDISLSNASGTCLIHIWSIFLPGKSDIWIQLYGKTSIKHVTEINCKILSFEITGITLTNFNWKPAHKLVSLIYQQNVSQNPCKNLFNKFFKRSKFHSEQKSQSLLSYCKLLVLHRL